MRAKINYHDGLYAALNYNYEKAAAGEAVPLSHSSDIEIENSDLKSTYALMKTKSMGTSIEDYVIHAKLNFQPGTPVDLEKFKQVHDEYIQQMGWQNLSFRSWVHTDRLHPHIHIVAVRERNVYKELNKSHQVVEQINAKFNLIQEYSPEVLDQVQRMTVTNQVKLYLEKVRRAKNLTKIDDIQRVFNAMSPTYKMFVNHDRKTICFVHEFNKSFLQVSDLKDKAGNGFLNLYKIWKKDSTQAFGIDHIQSKDLRGFDQLELSTDLKKSLIELQHKASEKNIKEFEQVFSENLPGYEKVYHDDLNDVVFINKKEQKYCSLKNVINSSTLHYKTTYAAWQKKVEQNSKRDISNQTTLPRRRQLSKMIISMLDQENITDFDSLQKACLAEGLHFIYYGNTNQETGLKQITGWSLYDERSSLLFKMSDINRDLSYKDVAARLQGKAQRKPATKQPVKRLPKSYFSPYLKDNNYQYYPHQKRPFAGKNSNNKTNNKSNDLTNDNLTISI